MYYEYQYTHVIGKDKKCYAGTIIFFYPLIDQQYRVSLYFVYWIKYHQSTPVQTISSEIKQISLNNLQWDYNLRRD